MAVSLRWVNENENDRVAETRLRCYAPAANELEQYRQTLRIDPRSIGADILLAEQDGVAVGTATSIPLTMWVRGGAISCQGVAYVGTIKTARRSGSKGKPGIGTQLMNETLRLARERGHVVSALMPWRASFYEHFGYGLVERRHDWTLPLSVLPTGDFAGIRFYNHDDLDVLIACRQGMAERGQCDIERSKAMWQFKLALAEDGFVVVDRPEPGGPIRGWMHFRHAHESGKDILRIPEIGYEDVPALLRLLRFLASLKDQFLSAFLTLPADFPLTRLLRETQIPHRPVNHTHAEVRPYTRMQVRVLDHQRFIEGLSLPSAVRGRVTVAIRETEGQDSRLAIEMEDGRATVSAAKDEAQFACADVTWAAIACGELSATTAVRLGLARCGDPVGTALLDALAVGPTPFCGEYF